jgi:hypothetical protein
VNHYVIIDGVIQRSSPDTKRWTRRAAKEVPKETSETDAVALVFTERTEYEIVESLEENDAKC